MALSSSYVLPAGAFLFASLYQFYFAGDRRDDGLQIGNPHLCFFFFVDDGAAFSGADGVFVGSDGETADTPLFLSTYSLVRASNDTCSMRRFTISAIWTFVS